jgi:hypothetical protein
MNRGPALKYQVQEQLFDPKSMLDEQNFYSQKQGSPSELTRKLTYILGDYTKQFPLSSMTTGSVGYNSGLKGTQVELDDIQFTYPVMGSDTKVSVCSSSAYQSGDKPGVGNSEFKIRFADNWIKRFFVIQSEHGIQAFVNQDPTHIGGEWEYTVVLAAATADDYCPYTELAGGVRWIELFTAAPESESRSTESTMVSPGLYKNQMGIIRAGMSWAGNAAEKTMKLSVTGANGKTSNVWMDLFMWQFEKAWLSQCEHQYWYSRYNRLSNGSIPLKDVLTGKVIPLGSGLLEQITNKSTYSTLTYQGLQNKIGDALFGQTDADNMTITLMTGKGGMRAIDTAMKAEGIKFLTSFGGGDIADKFVTGTGRDLMLGGFFTGFYHIDGYTIKVKYNPLFDHGKVAKASPRHPETGYPLESYRMVFIDDNDYDGQPNLQVVCQKGRALMDGVVKGLTSMPRSLQIKGNFDSNLNSALLSTEVDKSSYTRLSTRGIQLLRANKCFDLQCVAGL